MKRMGTSFQTLYTIRWRMGKHQTALSLQREEDGHVLPDLRNNQVKDGKHQTALCLWHEEKDGNFIGKAPNSPEPGTRQRKSGHILPDLKKQSGERRKKHRTALSLGHDKERMGTSFQTLKTIRWKLREAPNSPEPATRQRKDGHVLPDLKKQSGER